MHGARKPCPRHPNCPQDILSFEGFYRPLWKLALYWATALCTAGISLLACTWSPRLYIKLSMSKCHLRDAQFVRIKVRARAPAQLGGGVRAVVVVCVWEGG